MQSLADGGGICISGAVYEHIKNELTLWHEYLRKQGLPRKKKTKQQFKTLP
jgi:class 3 adenylate cyclase